MNGAMGSWIGSNGQWPRKKIFCNVGNTSLSSSYLARVMVVASTAWDRSISEHDAIIFRGGKFPSLTGQALSEPY